MINKYRFLMESFDYSYGADDNDFPLIHKIEDLTVSIGDDFGSSTITKFPLRIVDNIFAIDVILLPEFPKIATVQLGSKLAKYKPLTIYNAGKAISAMNMHFVSLVIGHNNIGVDSSSKIELDFQPHQVIYKHNFLHQSGKSIIINQSVEKDKICSIKGVGLQKSYKDAFFPVGYGGDYQIGFSPSQITQTFLIFQGNQQKRTIAKCYKMDQLLQQSCVPGKGIKPFQEKRLIFPDLQADISAAPLSLDQALRSGAIKIPCFLNNGGLYTKFTACSFDFTPVDLSSGIIRIIFKLTKPTTGKGKSAES